MLSGQQPRARHDFEEDHGRDRWMVSYADFITLLMAFFVVMYSISSVNNGKFRVLSNSMITVFNEEPAHPAPIDLGGGAPRQEVTAAPQSVSVLENVAGAVATESGAPAGDAVDLAPVPAEGTARERLEATFAPLVDSSEVRIRESEDWLEVEVASELLFTSGSADLQAAADPVIARIAAVAGEIGQPVRIEGHTDARPIRGGPYSSNWQLSAARAATIAERLTAAKLPPERLSAVGYGEFRPIASNDRAEGRRQNRRVVIAIARHPGISATETSGSRLAPQAPAAPRTLQRITALPGPADIEP